MTDRRATWLYGLALLPACGLALAASGWVMDLTAHSAPGRPSGLVAWAENVLPALAVGLLVYLPLARFVRAHRLGVSSLGGHLQRCAVLYLAALAIGVPLAHDASSQDFWSLGQLALWSWLVPVAGVAADGWTARRRSEQAPSREVGKR